MLGQVGDHQADRPLAVHSKRTGRNGHRDERSITGAQGKLGMDASLKRLHEQFTKPGRVASGDERLPASADDPVDRDPEQRWQAGVTVEDGAVRGEGGRPLLHAVYK